MTLFGSKDEILEKSGAAGLSPEMEKSLQRMLENQASAKSAVFDFSKGHNAATHLPPTPSVGGSPEVAAQAAEALAQVEKMRTEVSARDRSIQELKSQLETAQTEAKKASGSGGSGLDARVKELEARLAEYDIISEDIADLSRYKEENEKLRKQLAAQGSAPTPAPVAAAPVVAATPAPAPAPVAAPAAAPVTVTPVDDDLMKEFAQAVESQKTQTPQTPVPPQTQENEDLMGQFENFVQKKEGS